jgi:hypothetical protein
MQGDLVDHINDNATRSPRGSVTVTIEFYPYVP